MIDQFRKLVKTISPAQLSRADCVDLIDLLDAAYKRQNSGGGGASNASRV